ncbi:hypothetical protein GCM10012287_19350 [Streptomyces daqingensis]|uniref:G domain-containing protein n=1 Tax=Streptomyces daqingensis TaxID=1472640 RepID=A0ABQ2M5R8_9ACTN|nr:GTPase [Streptomyces daqingensis]GGO47214.1 hypothetical protein GCM10012287_19350 [Streptomyces daqingensis]
MSTTDVRIDGSSDEKQAAPDAAAGSGGPPAVSGGNRERQAAATEGGAAAEQGEGTAADGEAGAWDDGLIARRAHAASAPGERPAWSRAAALWGTDPDPEPPDSGGPGVAAAPGRQMPGWSSDEASPVQPYEDFDGHEEYAQRAHGAGPRGAETSLSQRLAALSRLLDLSRSRIPSGVLAEAQRVLDAAGARKQLPSAYTTVAIAGATGSGKSSLFNALAGTRLSQAGMRRPTTATPVACSWEVPGAGPADGLLDRLAIPQSTRRLMRPESDWRGRIDDSARHELEGLVLIDLPDHDSAADGHRAQVDRLLRLVDAVVWVVDPEKYADAVLHERYLRPLAGYAEVTFIVLNQTDRLPGEAKDAVLNDLRRLLDEDGMALGDHGEPGARVLATSALGGEGVDELRTDLAQFVALRRAAGLRLNADLDGVVGRLRAVYVPPGHVPAAASADALSGLTEEVRDDFADRLARAAGAVSAGQAAERAWLRLADRACGTPWARLQHWYDDRRSAKEEPAAAELGDAEAASAEAEAYAFSEEGGQAGAGEGGAGGELPDVPAASAAARPAGDRLPRVSRPAVAHAVRTVVEQAGAGLPEAWHRSVRDAAWRGAAGLPEALDRALREDDAPEGAADGAERDGQSDGGTTRGGRTRAAAPRRPAWWALAFTGQLVLLLLQLVGAGWVAATALGAGVGEEWMGVALLLGGVLGGSLLSWGCRFAARGPAAVYGQREEWRLRRLVASCGQVRVLEPVAAELLRYREVREQYVIVSGEAGQL